LFPSILVPALIALGSGCIIISISILHYFRERAITHINEKVKTLFSKKETLAFLKGIKEGKVGSSMLRDFSNELFESLKPMQWLKELWAYFPTSGIFFIVVGLLGSFADYQNPIFDSLIYALLIIAIALLTLGICQLVRLGRKLM